MWFMENRLPSLQIKSKVLWHQYMGECLLVCVKAFDTSSCHNISAMGREVVFSRCREGAKIFIYLSPASMKT
ncbi:hypothetical protein TSUD_103610 [Trifolium subterraneum]|uniref:Uncharacterized protein n=1 Tax=Trifolium subterraneum TaxID=3900 RepID=A0A2Z6MRU3_TRISU|nr:hypothetical protein TSUD_103610 [Trifolium subterraneum]